MIYNNMPSDKLTILSFTISKFIFTIIIWIVFFSYDTDYVWEDNMTILYNNLYQKTLHNNLVHEITEETKKSQCIDNIELCKKINNNFIKEEIKEKYTDISINTIKKIENILWTYQEWLIKNIHNITLKSEKWGKRWYANHNNIVINIEWLSEDEFVQVLTHELWHIIDLWVIKWNNGNLHAKFTEFWKKKFYINDISLLFYNHSRESEFQRKTEAKQEDFCSLYGMTNPFEDIAECINIYLNHNSYFKTIKKSSPILEKKYNFLTQIFNNKYISNKNENQNIYYRYWDSTRME